METTGAFVISLDFELSWGLSDRQNQTWRVDATRRLVPQILELFEQYEIHATWATVGALFARRKSELASVLDGTFDLSTVGADEQSDRAHFGRSLIELIQQTPHQEIGLHGLTHRYLRSLTLDEFNREITGATALASQAGVTARSIVYPNNEDVSPEHRPVLEQNGITCTTHLPNATGFMSRPRRLVQTYIPLSATQRWEDIYRTGTAVCERGPIVRFRDRRTPFTEPLKKLCLQAYMKRAARRGEIVHLWWHPHNMATDPTGNLQYLEHLLQYAASLRDTYSMRSFSMAEAADRCYA